MRPLPYPQPDRIVAISSFNRAGDHMAASYNEFAEWRQLSKSFGALAAYDDWESMNARIGDLSTPMPVMNVADTFFDVFGVKPLLGRTFARGEELPGHNSVAVLSDDVWRHRFQADPEVLGKSLVLDGQAVTIVGVMPAGFRFPLGERDAVFIPLHMTRMQRDNADNMWLKVVWRLKPGLTPAVAAQQFNRTLTEVGRVNPDLAGIRATLTQLRTALTGNREQGLRLLFCAVLAILLLGCANLSGMLLARGLRLEREMALRAA